MLLKHEPSGSHKTTRRPLAAMGTLVLLVIGLIIGNAKIAQAAPTQAPGALPPNCERVLVLLYNCWYYVGATQNVTLGSRVGAFAEMDQYAPSLEDASDHSLVEITVHNNLGNDEYQAIELGWMVSPDGFGGDLSPHLFVHETNGPETSGCYVNYDSGCAWHQVSTTPGHTPTDIVNVTATPQPYGILYYQGNWWINYQNDWIGYIPGSYWGGKFTSFGTAQWYGEVYYSETDSTQPNRCDYMGNGIYGSDSGAAVITDMGLWDPQFHIITPAASPFVTAPNAYDMGGTAAGHPISHFSYGGPGVC